MKSVGVLIVFCVAACFAAGEYGSIGDAIMVPIAKLFGVDIAGKIVAAIVAVVGWIIARVILKKIPTSMQGIAGKIFWSIAKGAFGDGVVLANHNDPEYLKQELIKKYPTLQIDVKKLAGDK